MTTLDRFRADPLSSVGDVRPAFVAVGAACVAAAMLLARGVGDYAATYWYFTYDQGLVARAAAGTVFQVLGGDPQQHLRLAATVVYVAASGALLWGVSRLTVGWSRMGTVVAAVTLFHLTIPHLATQSGRPDGILIVLAVGAAALAGRAVAGRHLLIGLLLAASVMVHEAAVLLTVVWVAAFVADVESPDVRRRAVGVVLLPPVMVSLVLAVHRPAVEAATLASRIFPESVPSHIAMMAVETHYRSLHGAVSDVADLVTTTPEWLAFGLWFGLLPMAVVWVVSWVALRLSAVSWSGLSLTERLMFAGAACPLLLLPVAHDWFRWFMFSGLLVGMSTVVVLSKRRVSAPVWVVPVAVAVAIPVGLATSGPL